MAKKKNHFVDNKALLQAFKNYLPIVRPLREAHRKMCTELLKKGVKKRDLPKLARPQTADYDYIGAALLEIAKHLSYKYNYIRYTFKEEMVGDAIENAIASLENFNPDKYDNPHAYFTQLMIYAFSRRITYEEQKEVVKKMSIENKAQQYYAVQDGDSRPYNNTYVQFLNDNGPDIVSEYKEKRLKKKVALAEKAKLKRKENQSLGMDEFLVSLVD